MWCCKVLSVNKVEVEVEVYVYIQTIHAHTTKFNSTTYSRSCKLAATISFSTSVNSTTVVGLYEYLFFSSFVAVMSIPVIFKSENLVKFSLF